MILWLASYPKSGNTWLRLLISNYLWPDGTDIFGNLKYIPKFPKKNYFEGIVDEENLKQNSLEIFKYFIPAQEIINKNNELKILKTHNFAGSIKGYPFTNSKNSSGAIYIVRDPRSVVVSSAYHNDYEFEKSTERIMSNKNVSLNDGFMEARLTWKIHYLSWKKIDIPKIIIKYEDLFSDPLNKFLEVLKFINQFKKVPTAELFYLLPLYLYLIYYPLYRISAGPVYRESIQESPAAGACIGKASLPSSHRHCSCWWIG